MVVGSSTAALGQAVADVVSMSVPPQSAKMSAAKCHARQRRVAHLAAANAKPAVTVRLNDTDMRATARLALRQDEFVRLVRQVLLPRIAMLGNLVARVLRGMRSELINTDATHVLFELPPGVENEIDDETASCTLVVRGLKNGVVCAVPHKPAVLEILSAHVRLPHGVEAWASRDVLTARRCAVFRDIVALFSTSAWRSDAPTARIALLVSMSRAPIEFLQLAAIAVPAVAQHADAAAVTHLVITQTGAIELGRIGQLKHNGADMLHLVFPPAEAAADDDDDDEMKDNNDAPAEAAASLDMKPAERVALSEYLQTLNLKQFELFAPGASSIQRENN